MRNDAIVQTQGIDMRARYEKATDIGRFAFTMNGTYILEFAESSTADLPLFDRVSTPNHPIDLTLHGSARWQRGGLALSAYVHYFDSYRDTVSTPQRRVHSWTTVDLYESFEPDVAVQSWLGNTSFTLGVQNLLDTDPPFLNNSIGIGYDQENGDLVGRMVRLSLRKKW